MNFGSARIVVIVALVVAGVAILAGGFGEGSSTLGAVGLSPSPSTPSPSAQGSPGATPTQPALPDPRDPADVVIAVFNGTSELGLAAQGEQILTEAGYVAGQDAANSPVPGISKSVIYYRGGPDADQNKADARLIAQTYFEGAKVELLGDAFETVIEPNVQVVVALGQDYANTVGG